MSAETHPATRSPTTTAAAPAAAAPPRDAPLRMSAEEFRRAGHALVDEIAASMTAVADGRRPVTTGESPQAIQALVDASASLPESGDEDVEALLRSTAALLFDHSLFNGHPQFYGYITSSPAPIGMLGDFLAAAVNPNVGSWRLGPVATEIEAQTVRWIAEMIGYPTSSGGLLVSGGNMANFVAFLAARKSAAAWDVRAAGLGAPEARPLRVYASAETHTWIQKAADLFGLGTDSIRWIPTGDDLRMDTGALRAAMARDRDAGDVALMVVGTAGSVSTGAVDPLAEIAAICRDAGAWFHVDGAYGALAAVMPDAPADLRALALADSVAVDPHKWLYAPLEAGCTLVRDPALLRDAFAYHPPYYHFGQEAVNFVDLGPQNSRGFRALKVWLALRRAGRAGYARTIAEDCRLAERLAERCAAHPELEVVTQSLSITTFRYVPGALRASVGAPDADAYLDALNEALIERIQSSGEAFVSNAVIRGRYVLRACVVNFNTTAAHVDALPEIVVRMGREVAAEMRDRRG